jgi:hypothetical protein
MSRKTRQRPSDDASHVVASVLSLGSMPGDYGLGWFGARDKGRHERELICELEHGRLAQLAFVVQLILEQRSGLPWEQQWAQLHLEKVLGARELLSASIDVA